MTAKDALLAAAVIVIWGVNFFFMKLALNEISPMLLGVLRFICVALPAVFLVKKPPVKWRWLLAYGLTISFGQFSMMFTSLAIGMPTGLAALMVQTQVFFTVILASLLWQESVRPNQFVAMLVAVIGLVLIGVGQYQGQLPMLGLGLVILAAFSWACGNLVVKHIGKVNPISLVVWGNVLTIIPFAVVGLWLDGVGGMWQQLTNMSWKAWVGVAFLAYAASLIGYVCWGKLLADYPAAKVTPLALLVPVVSLIVAWLWLNESLNMWHWAGIMLMMLGLCIQVLGGKYFDQWLKKAV